MRMFHAAQGFASLAILGGGLVLLPACSVVSHDELGSELDRVQAEMREEQNDLEDRLSARMDRIESRLEGRVASLESELARFQDEFELTVERLGSAIRFNMPVHFAFDDATIRAEDRSVLERFAETIGSYYEGAMITVEGFADPAGPRAYNLRLGQRRAEAVKEYLVDAGIPGDRIRAVSYGDAPERQVAPGARGPGEEGWQNRRVAMVVDFEPSTGGPRIASSGGR